MYRDRKYMYRDSESSGFINRGGISAYLTVA